MASKNKSPKNEELREFEEIVKTAVQLIDRGIIIARTSLPGQIEFVFENEQIRPVLDLNKIAASDFSNTLKFEIASMASAILQRRRGAYASLVLRGERESAEKASFDEDAEKKLIEAKFDLIEKTIITGSIKRQVAIKRSSKIEVFHGMSWEINEKKFDKEERGEKNLSQAVIRLDIKKPLTEESEFPFPFFGNAEGGIQSIAFTACREDIEQIFETLADVKRRMSDLDKEVR